MREDYQRLYENARNEHYQNLVDMVADGKRDPEEVAQEEQEKKHQEMLKKANE